MVEDLSSSLARVVLETRTHRGYSVSGLAEASGVSRAMISRIERGEVQPTAALLAKLIGPLEVSLSQLIARAETGNTRVLRHDDRMPWTDEATGYTRVSLSPPGSGPMELIEVTVPPGVRNTYPAQVYENREQQVVVLEGELRITEGGDVHDLRPGDCLRFHTPQDTTIENAGETLTRYLTAVYRRPSP